MHFSTLKRQLLHPCSLFLNEKSPSKLCEHTHEDANWPATVFSFLFVYRKRFGAFAGASRRVIVKDAGHRATSYSYQRNKNKSPTVY